MIAKFCITTFITALKNLFLPFSILIFFLLFKSSHYIYSSATLILGLEVKQNLTLQNQCTFWYEIYLLKCFGVCDSNVSYHVFSYVDMDVYLVFTWLSENKDF